MAYINPEWYKQDEHARSLKVADHVANYNDSIDRQIRIACINGGIKTSEIPVDLSGFLTSDVLIHYGISLAIYEIFTGHWGIRATGGDRDIYDQKREDYAGRVAKAENLINRTNVLGTDDEKVDDQNRAKLTSIPVV